MRNQTVSPDCMIGTVRIPITVQFDSASQETCINTYQRPCMLAHWLQRRLSEEKPRAKSILMTVMGDSIEPHGGAIWIGSLARLLSPFGINERATRTSVFRLTSEHWLEHIDAMPGRKSHYQLTGSGRLRVAHAQRRIYDDSTAAWDGTWTFVLIGGVISASLRNDLQWEGFGRLSPTLYAHPSPNIPSLTEIWAQHSPKINLTLFRANELQLPAVNLPTDNFPARHLSGVGSGHKLVELGWDLRGLSVMYRAFLERYTPLASNIGQFKATAEECFTSRTILIHDFRRAQLRDPGLPSTLLPPDWPGIRAKALCKALYLALTPQAGQHILAVAEGPHGPLPHAAPYFLERFGGTN